jgi:hypothetical protein
VRSCAAPAVAKPSQNEIQSFNKALLAGTAGCARTRQTPQGVVISAGRWAGVRENLYRQTPVVPVLRVADWSCTSVSRIYAQMQAPCHTSWGDGPLQLPFWGTPTRSMLSSLNDCVVILVLMMYPRTSCRHSEDVLRAIGNAVPPARQLRGPQYLGRCKTLVVLL